MLTHRNIMQLKLRIAGNSNNMHRYEGLWLHIHAGNILNNFNANAKRESGGGGGITVMQHKIVYRKTLLVLKTDAIRLPSSSL
jgi:hypothetical protein